LAKAGRRQTKDKGSLMRRKENDIQTASLMAGIFATIAAATGALATALALVAIASRPSATAIMRWQFHHLDSAIIIALSNNVDNLGARLAYSVQGTRINLLVNAWIALITFTISTLAAYRGEMIISALGNSFASFLSMAMLVC
jgi:hypothetical protein